LGELLKARQSLALGGIQRVNNRQIQLIQARQTLRIESAFTNTNQILALGILSELKIESVLGTVRVALGILSELKARGVGYTQ
jgi:hypothetical protein